MTATIPRPTSAEFAPYYSRYIERIPERADPLQLLSAQFDAVPAVFLAVPRDREEFRYAPEKWSIRQVVGHLCDAERIFAYRILRIARADATPLPGFEENDYVRNGGFDARSLADLTSDWTTARRSTIALARGLAPEVWERRGTASGHPVSARAILYIIVGHVQHHLGILKERYGVAM
jgi:uncharacterized damage-inducible protein DinB